MCIRHIAYHFFEIDLFLQLCFSWFSSCDQVLRCVRKSIYPSISIHAKQMLLLSDIISALKKIYCLRRV